MTKLLATLVLFTFMIPALAAARPQGLVTLQTINEQHYQQQKHRLTQKGFTILKDEHAVKTLTIRALYLGPLLTPADRQAVARSLHKIGKLYRFSHNRRYVYLGTFALDQDFLKWQQRLQAVGLTQLHVRKKKKQATVYTLVARPPVTTPSSPPLGQEGQHQASVNRPPTHSTSAADEGVVGNDGFFRIFMRDYTRFHQGGLGLWGVSRAHWSHGYNQHYSVGAAYDLTANNLNDSKQELHLEPASTYGVWSQAWWKLTAGFQPLIWGDYFEAAFIDRFDRENRRYGRHFPLAERRRDQAALRYQAYLGDWNFDLVAIPYFRPDVIPVENHFWSSVNKDDGGLLGVAPSSDLASIVKYGRIQHKDPQRQAAGLRVNFPLLGGEGAFTYAYGPSLTPYYKINPLVSAGIASGLPGISAASLAPDDTLITVYPVSSFIAFDGSHDWQGRTYQFAIGYTDKTPYTSKKLVYNEAPGLDWVIDSRLGLPNGSLRWMLSGHHLLAHETSLDLKNQCFLGALYSLPMVQELWRLNVKGQVGLLDSDFSLSPTIAYTGDARNVFDLGADLSWGHKESYGGFYGDHTNITIAWKHTY